MTKADAVELILERAERTGLRFHYGEVMDPFSVLREVRKLNPARVDAIDDAFESGDMHPEEYWKRSVELIEMAERTHFVLQVEKKILTSRPVSSPQQI